MAFLNETGLQFLIDQVQNQVIRKYNYEDISTNENDFAYLLKIKKINNTTSWIIKYQVISEIPEDSNSKQVSDVIIGGVGAEIAYYNVNNIVYDTARNGIDNHRVLVNEEDILLGVDLGKNYLKPHNIEVNVNFISGGSVKKIIESNQYSTILINCNKNGSYISETEESVKKSDFSSVAFSGNYNDLINQPELLNMNINEEELLFFLQ